ncbi:MAG: ATP-binding protein [Chloroflexi bacterium]|nr:ATP-binding protein [Chloroflexota bacterium]
MILPRFLTERLPAPTSHRLVMITGARQTGKTTLAQATYPGLRYISLDEIETRSALRDLPTRAWASSVGPAVLDEAQKEPSLFEKVKFAFDAGEVGFTVLLGSSQILMLKRIRETLAGRAFVYELWPLTLREMTAAGAVPAPPLFDRLLTTGSKADDVFSTEPAVLLGDEAHQQTAWLSHALTWGGMPGLLDLSDTDRRDWLRSYTNTYLERDLSDLARLDDLEPFRRFLRLAALRSGQVISYADLARDAAISPTTARNYFNHLALSYQAFLLPPSSRSQTKTLVKAPKLYWVDPGLWRQQTGFWGEVTGPLLETFVVGEVHKWIKTLGRSAEIWFYRTYGGLEVDLLITTGAGIWGIGVKAGKRLASSDATPLRRVAGELGNEWRGGIVTYLGERLERLDSNLWAVPVARLFG